MSFELPNHSPELLADLEKLTHAFLVSGAEPKSISVGRQVSLLFASKGISLTNRDVVGPIDGHRDDDNDGMHAYMQVVSERAARRLGLKTIMFPVIGSVLICTNTALIAMIRLSTTILNAVWSIRGLESVVEPLSKHIQDEVGAKLLPAVQRVKISRSNDTLWSENYRLTDTMLSFDPAVVYPHFEESPASLWKRFSESSSNILFLIGPPGTGKSSYLRALLDVRGYDTGQHELASMVSDTNVVKHQGFSEYIADLNHRDLLVVEDSDSIVGKREGGNSDMAALLNATSGLVENGAKFIISTNLPNLKSVDPALIRPGRAFKVLSFKLLTEPQAHAVRSSMGLPPVTFNNDSGEYTLAEAIHWDDYHDHVPKAPIFGFFSNG